MNTVYKITNLINQKKYIGSSVRVEKRWQQHKNDAFNPNNEKYNYPLYAAFRKYGLNNFSFEILKDDFETIEEMQQYEQNMIFQYKTLAPNGYNQTINTNNSNICKENLNNYLQRISKKCALVNKNNEIIEIYNSYHAAARAQGWDGDAKASLIKNICDGKINDNYGLIFRNLNENNEVIIPEIKARKRRTAVYGVNKNDPNDIVYYESISEAARQEKIDRGSISKCIAGSTRYSVVKGRIWRKVGE